MSDIIERARNYVSCNAAESGADVLMVEMIAEITRLRREKKALVTVLRPLLRLTERYDAKYTELGSSLPKEIVVARAALCSVSCQADFSPCTFPTCACSATETEDGQS